MPTLEGRGWGGVGRCANLGGGGDRGVLDVVPTMGSEGMGWGHCTNLGGRGEGWGRCANLGGEGMGGVLGVVPTLEGEGIGGCLTLCRPWGRRGWGWGHCTNLGGRGEGWGRCANLGGGGDGGVLGVVPTLEGEGIGGCWAQPWGRRGWGWGSCANLWGGGKRTPTFYFAKIYKLDKIPVSTYSQIVTGVMSDKLSLVFILKMYQAGEVN